LRRSFRKPRFAGACSFAGVLCADSLGTWTVAVQTMRSYMPRIQTLFASAAVVVLLLGLLTSRINQTFGLTISLRHSVYACPNSVLCYGVALFFCFFALLYSVWTVPWSAQAARWHFALSVLLVGVFCAASFAAVRFKVFGGSSRLAIPILVAFSLSPVLFLLVQGFFLLDGFRRAWPVFRG